MPEILVSLVQLGFLGFSVAIMYLAYRLLESLVNSSGQNPTNMRLKVTAVVSFMVLSATSIGLGIFYSLSDPAVDLTIDLLPEEKRFVGVNFRLANTTLPWAGATIVSVKDGNRLTVDLYKLERAMAAMEDRLDRLEVQNRGLTSFNRAVGQSNVEFLSEADDGGI